MEAQSRGSSKHTPQTNSTPQTTSARRVTEMLGCDIGLGFKGLDYCDWHSAWIEGFRARVDCTLDTSCPVLCSLYDWETIMDDFPDMIRCIF